MRASNYLPLCTIAGSDPTGGAGLQGDLKTFAAHGARGTAVVTAVTVQGREGVRAVHPVPADAVAAQLDVVLAEVRPAALKTGMLWSAETTRAVAACLRTAAPSALVVDPVLVATAGGALLEADGLDTLRRELAPLARVLTPNLPEAAALLGRATIEPDEADEAAEALLGLGCDAVLLTGGHATGETAEDVLATADGVERLALPRVAGVAGHGTGCALSAALAARLARGETLGDAARGAKAYVHGALASAAARGETWFLDHRVRPPEPGPFASEA